MSAAPRVLFVADAGRAVGGGHVMRCLTLADALVRAGAACAFAASPEASEILDAFGGPEIRRFGAPSGEPSALCAFAAEVARTWGARIVVIDHYGAGPLEDAVLRAAAGRLLAMEDLGHRRVCDLLLDSGLGRDADDYPAIDALIGPAFALVRPGFAKARSAALARRRGGGAATSILISLGLTDVGGITERVVEAVLPVLGERRLEVALGAGARSLGAVTALAAHDSRVRPHVDTRDMEALIAAADLVIGAGGSSAWERCVLGAPSVALILADNQRTNTLALAAAGAALALELNGELTRRLREAFLSIVGDEALRARMSQAAAGLCDGLGAERVAARMLASMRGAGAS